MGPIHCDDKKGSCKSYGPVRNRILDMEPVILLWCVQLWSETGLFQPFDWVTNPAYLIRISNHDKKSLMVSMSQIVPLPRKRLFWFVTNVDEIHPQWFYAYTKSINPPVRWVAMIQLIKGIHLVDLITCLTGIQPNQYYHD